MPRKREGEVHESDQELQRLDRALRGKPAHARIRFIMALKANPSIRLDDLAAEIGCSLPTAKRWWKTYRTLGLPNLIELGTSVRKATRSDSLVHALAKRISSGEVSTLGDVAAWLSIQGVRAPTESNGFQLPDLRVSARSDEAADGDSREARLIAFIAAMSPSSMFTEWSDAFRASMTRLFTDVDHVSISVNVRCDVVDPAQYAPRVLVSQVVQSKSRDGSLRITEVSESPQAYAERLVEQLHRRKFPKREYHLPFYREYYLGETAYLGTLVLWRRRGKPPISSATISFVNELQPVIRFVLADFVARHQLAKPIGHAFTRTLESITDEAHLTLQERRIMMLLLVGQSYDEIAATLNISLNTVRYHVRSIFAKTGTHSQAHLVAKYFSLRYDSYPEPE